jgi:hypothetical protein
VIAKSIALTAAQFEWGFVQNDAPSNFYSYRSNGSAFTTLNSGIAVVANVWRHLLTTYDGTTLVVYVDGAFAASTTVTTTHTVSSAFSIGNDGSARFAAGNIDDVRVWHRSLSAAEAFSVYHDSRNFCRSTLNWIRRPNVFSAASGNRRRRVICGAAA